MDATEDAALAPSAAAQRHGASFCAELLNLNMSLKTRADHADEGSVTPDQEAAQQAVEELVAHYQGKARAVGRAGIAIGATLGVLVGSVPLSPLKSVWPIPATFGFATVLGGLAAGLLIGYVIGGTRARMYQRMAEQSRLQLQLEARLSQSDARMSQLLTALTARAVRAKAAEPVAPPDPVAAPVAPAPVLAPPVYEAPAPAPTQPVHAPQPVVVEPAPEPAPPPAPALPPIYEPAAYEPAATTTPEPPAAPVPVAPPHLMQVPRPTPYEAPQQQPPLSPPVSGSNTGS